MREQKHKNFGRMSERKPNENLQNLTNKRKFARMRERKPSEIFKTLGIKKIWTISRFMRVILAQGPC
ncbi:hypothetical protein KFK09_003142 [Dendrobium nobile]|uniref:Uncharacterized protein n=1 Tax=Dendrobium nobile TaxID=94219 RepID=A0A8T3C5P5_DENNO|nr:hypothetical protein KFK09_003142 [Dendrobium nobile]